MVTDKLAAALGAVKWNDQVSAFLALNEVPTAYAECNMRLAVWSRQIEEADAGNAALPFLREMQVSGQHVTALAALSLYKAAAASARTVTECALYYIYFRTHRTELSTLLRDRTYFVDKTEIVTYLKKHIPDYQVKQEAVGLLSELAPWYSEISAIVHGQKPGAWSPKTPLKDLAPSTEATVELRDLFCTGVRIVDSLFKVSLAPEIWVSFSKNAKQYLIKGMSGEQKIKLGLDSA
jgi:hypothetical protein